MNLIILADKAVTTIGKITDIVLLRQDFEKVQQILLQLSGKTVVQDVTAAFEKGKITVLAGPNGCGKSTLLKAIVGIVSNTSGEIFIDGISAKDMDSKQLAKRVAYLAQNKKAPELSVMKMVLHGRFAHLGYPRKYGKKDFEIARRAIDWVGLNEEAETIVSKLSGGMQQKAYIAMALAQETDTILMDEPTTYLDVSHQLRLMDMARKLAAEGKSVVMVLHDLSQALQIGDQIVVMKDGRIISQGTGEEVYENKSLQKAFDVEIERVAVRNGWNYICMLK